MQKELFVIGISGRSCSGKSVFTQELASFNKEIFLLQTDCYFNKFNSCSYAGYQCWEHINCIDFQRLINDILSLKCKKDTLINVSTPWMPNVNINISTKDLEYKKILIIDGYLTFVVKELLQLFDYKVFINASDYTILQRRMKRNGVQEFNYICDVVIPVSKEYEKYQINQADMVVNGDNSKNDVINKDCKELCDNIINTRFININIPPYKNIWEVYPNDLIMDTAWHPISFDNYKKWVKDNKNKLDNGEVLKGNTFRYRKNNDTNTYEVRLSSQYSPSLYRYNKEPSLSW